MSRYDSRALYYSVDRDIDCRARGLDYLEAPVDSTTETLVHKKRVQELMTAFAIKLLDRAGAHDNSKLIDPEKSMFDLYTPILAGAEYGSEEYSRVLREMGPALEHHYQNNSHHPQHYTDGVTGMDLVDLVEMACDWLASTERVNNGDFVHSIYINEKRFSIAPQVSSIFFNTAKRMGWIR